MNIGNINIDDIDEPEFLIRDYSDTHLSELKKSISEHGIRIPLMVRENNGRYRLIDGVYRYIIARNLGIKELPCYIISAHDAEELEVQMQTSMRNAPTDPIDYAKALKRL